MSVSAHDVAAELRRRFPYSIGRAKLHKLLYYAQGWHLTWMGRPLFRERIEAWSNGPVVADLWRAERYAHGSPSPQALSSDQLATIDYVVERYGRVTGKDLVRRTHEEDPWRDASEVDADGWGVENAEITHGALHAWFSNDEECVRRSHEVERFRESGVYTFDRSKLMEHLEAAVDDALEGERVHPTKLR